jgi:hypothetical protein
VSGVQWVRWTALAVAALSCVSAVLIVRNCEARDAFQGLAIAVLPPVTGLAAGASVASSSDRWRGRLATAVFVAVGTATLAFVLVMLVFVGSCAS